MPRVVSSTVTARTLARLFGPLAVAPPALATRASSTNTTAVSQSTSRHRRAQASPRRSPVAATSRTKPKSRRSPRRAAASRRRTCAAEGTRTPGPVSARDHSGSSVSATGFESVLPLQRRARRHARCRTARVWRTVALDRPAALRPRRYRSMSYGPRVAIRSQPFEGSMWTFQMLS